MMGQIDYQEGKNLEQKALRGIAMGDKAQGEKDLWLARMKMNQGSFELNQGQKDVALGNY